LRGRETDASGATGDDGNAAVEVDAVHGGLIAGEGRRENHPPPPFRRLQRCFSRVAGKAGVAAYRESAYTRLSTRRREKERPTVTTEDFVELKYGALSPYVRKVMVVAHEAGVADRIKLTPVKTAEEPERIFPFNPLGKIPALIMDDGSAMYDSPVICEYLDAEFGGHRLLPASGPKRWRAMTKAALADGLLDAGILVRHERLRPAERQSQDWLDRQVRKILSGLDALESDAASLDGAFDMGQVGVGCALGYLPLRVPETKDPTRWPKLTAWFAKVSERPSFAKTLPVL